MHAGQRVSAGEQIATFVAGGSIEMGFADASGTPLSHGEYHEGDETVWGHKMADFLAELGGPSALSPGLGSLSPDKWNRLIKRLGQDPKPDSADRRPRSTRCRQARASRAAAASPAAPPAATRPGESGFWPSSSDSCSSSSPARSPSPDGRYLARERRRRGAQSVLVIETLGAAASVAPPAPARARRRPAAPSADAAADPGHRGAGLRALRAEHGGGRWLEEAVAAEEHDRRAARRRDRPAQPGAARPRRGQRRPPRAELSPERAVSGADRLRQRRGGRGGPLRGGARGRRPGRRRLAPATARPKSCAPRSGSRRCSAAASRSTPARRCCCAPAPTSTPAATREAALQLRVGLEALLVELPGAVADPGHEEDMATLQERRGEAGEAANVGAAGRPRRRGRERACASWSRSASGCCDAAGCCGADWLNLDVEVEVAAQRARRRATTSSSSDSAM